MEELSIISSLPEKRANYIVRKDTFIQIDDLFLTENIVILQGYAGIGKSSLASEYCHELVKSNNNLIARFLHADSPEKVNAEYRELTVEMNLNTVKIDSEQLLIKLVHTNLSKIKQRIIFIFDNVEEWKYIKNYICTIPKNLKALITTRNNNLNFEIQFSNKIVKLRPFNREETEIFIKKRLGHRNITKSQIDCLIKAIGTKDQCQVLPFKIEKAIAYIEHFQFGRIETLIQNIMDNFYDHAETILLLEIIMHNENSQAWKILQYAAFLDSDMISFKIFLNLLETDEFGLQPEIDILKKSSFVEVIHKHDDTFIKLHRLIQEEVQRSMVRNQGLSLDKEKLCKELIIVLNDLFYIVNPPVKNNFQIAQYYYSHIIKVLDLYCSLQPGKAIFDETTLVAVADLYIKIGYYNMNVTLNFQNALYFFKTALEKRLNIYGYNQAHQDIAFSYNSVGYVYKLLGDSKSALEYFQKSLKIYQELHIDDQNDSPELATCFNNVGIIYNALGDYDNAREYHEKALNMRTNANLLNYKDIAMSLNSLGTTFKRLGNPLAALEYFRKALEIYEQYNTEEDENLAVIYNNAGLILLEIGKIAEAINNLEKSYSIFNKIFNHNHPNIAAITNNIGSAYEQLGDKTKSLTHYVSALKIKEELYGKEHPDIAISLNNIGAIYRKLDEYEDALIYHHKALDIFNNTYKFDPNHPNIASTYNNIGNCYEKMQDFKTSITNYKMALKKFAIAHKNNSNNIDIATTLNNIGSVLAKTGEYESALEYLKNSLDMFTTIYNHKNLSLGVIVNNIGCLYFKLGRYTDALEYYKTALNLRIELNEINQNIMASSYSNIGIVYKELGDPQKSIEYFSKAFAIYDELNKPYSIEE